MTGLRRAELPRLVDVVLVLAAAVGCGIFLWGCLHVERLPAWLANELERRERLTLGGYILGALALWSALAGLLAIGSVRTGERLTARAALAALRVPASWSLLTLPAMGLSVWGIETAHRWLTLTLVAAAAGWLTVLVYRALDSGSWTPGALEPSVPTARHGVLLASMVAGYSLFVALLALTDHWTLGTHTYDLAIYDNVLWHSAHGKPLGSSFIASGYHMPAHFDPILLLLAPLYRLVPRAETLLVLQAVWLACGAIPVYRLALHHWRRPALALGLAAAYLLHPALHGANLFDFHSLTLVVPLVLWAVLWLDTERPLWLYGTLALILLTREDMALIALGVGLYALCSGRARRGGAIMGASALYFVLVKLVFLRETTVISPGYVYYFEELVPHPSEGLLGLLSSLVTSPIRALAVIFKPDKLHYWIVLLLPLLLAPLAAGRRLLMAGYGLFFIAMASRKYVYSPYFQYSSMLLPVLFAVTPVGLLTLCRNRLVEALGLAPRRLLVAAVVGLVCASATTSWKYGAFVPNDAFRGGWNRIDRRPSPEVRARYRALRALIERIPADASVSASDTLTPHISNRARAYDFPKHEDADYLLVRTTSLDRRGRWRLDTLRREGAYETVERRSDLELLRRAPP